MGDLPTSPAVRLAVTIESVSVRVSVLLGFAFALGCPASEDDATMSTTSGAGDETAQATTIIPLPFPTDGTGNDDGGGGTAMTTMVNDDAADSSTTDTFPPGPPCSVQEVTQGELVDPMTKGDALDLVPAIVGDMLEDYCGCHTLMNNGQNLKYEFLKAPGGTLFLDYDDLNRSFGGGTLGEAMSFQVIGNHAMPPGSCAFPDEPEAILSKWFEEGMPDGATFEAP